MRDLTMALAICGTVWTLFIGAILMEGINRIVSAIKERP